MKKVALAFSGGLDTSFCAVYLREKLGFDVISVTVDTGGFSIDELKRIEKKAKDLGVLKHYTIDAKDSVYDNFVTYIIKGNSLRGSVYPLSVGAERVSQAIEIARIALKENVDVVAHGSTGAGNDQVRFDVALSVLLPEKEILAPIRSLAWEREREAQWLKDRGIEVESEIKDYSINEGIWGTTIGGKETHDSWDFPPDSVFKKTKNISETPDKPCEISLGFKKGLPVSLNSKSKKGIDIVDELNKIAGSYGIGRGVHLGDTIMGIKGRLAFEAPAPTVLISAHREIEKLVLSKNQRFWKDHLGQVYGQMLHEGLYFDPVMRDIEAMIDSSQRNVTGETRIKLYRGIFMVIGLKSPYSLMRKDLATYGEVQNLWNSRDAEGFSKIYGMASKLYAIVNRDKWL